MSTDYRYIVTDDFDWAHMNHTKADIIQRIESMHAQGCQGVTIEAAVPNMIIFDGGHNHPHKVEQWLRLALVPFDFLYYVQDSGTSGINLWPKD